MDASTARSRRTWLLIILGVSIAVYVGTAAYATSLESWSDTQESIFTIVKIVAPAVALVALVLLIADFVRARRS